MLLLTVFSVITVLHGIALKAACGALEFHRSSYGRNLRHFQKPIRNRMVDVAEHNFLVSIRIPPWELHRCGGFLAALDVAVTTAECVLGTKGKNLYVALYDKDTVTEANYNKVVKIIPHPSYSFDAELNNVALLKLEKQYTHTPYSLGTVDGSLIVKTGDVVKMFNWGFDKWKPDSAEYFRPGYYVSRVISNGQCSAELGRYIACEYICSEGIPTNVIKEDVGTPIVLQLNTAKRRFRVIGLIDQVSDNNSATPYMAIQPYANWINDAVQNISIAKAPSETNVPSFATDVDLSQGSEPEDDSFDVSNTGGVTFTSGGDSYSPALDFDTID